MVTVSNMLTASNYVTSIKISKFMACNDLADNKFEGQNMLKTFFCNEHSSMLWNFCRCFVHNKPVWLAIYF